MCDVVVLRQARQRGMELPQAERAELLNLLKAKWGEVRGYHCL